MNHSTVFVVRVWTGPPFRAVVRQVDGEQAQMFEAPAALTRFFVAAAGGVDTEKEPRAAERGTDRWRTR